MLIKRIALTSIVAHAVGRFDPVCLARLIKLPGLIAEPENFFACFSCDIVNTFASEFTREVIGKRFSVRKKRFAADAVLQNEVVKINGQLNTAGKTKPFAVFGAFFFRLAKRKSVRVKPFSPRHEKTVVGIDAKGGQKLALVFIYRNTHTAVTNKVNSCLVVITFVYPV